MLWLDGYARTVARFKGLELRHRDGIGATKADATAFAGAATAGGFHLPFTVIQEGSLLQAHASREPYHRRALPCTASSSLCFGTAVVGKVRFKKLQNSLDTLLRGLAAVRDENQLQRRNLLLNGAREVTLRARKHDGCDRANTSSEGPPRAPAPRPGRRYGTASRRAPALG